MVFETLRVVVSSCIVGSVLLGTPSAQVEKPERKRVRLDYQLVFERVVNEAARARDDVVLRKTSFITTAEKASPGFGKQTDHTFSAGFFQNGNTRDPLPLPRPFILDVIRRMETIEDSPWKLAELRMTAKSGDMWIVEKLAFTRSEGQSESERIPGHVALETLAATRNGAEARDARISETRIEFRPPTLHSEGILDVEFCVLGTGFASAYDRFRQALVDTCSLKSSPFEKLRDVHRAEPLDDTNEPGSSYRLAMGLRVSVQDHEPDKERAERDEESRPKRDAGK